jgi:uncharacterized protein
MKYTLLVTRHCNLRCEYCYVGKDRSAMSLDVARRIVDFAYSRTPSDESIDFAFFGGEPLIEFDRVRQITSLIEEHPQYDASRVQLTMVSNGTLFNDEIAQFVREKNIAFGISCDGPAEVHDRFRRYPGGKGSSEKVEQTLRDALDAFDNVMVNAVYRPESFEQLPQTIEYFSSLGLRQIYLSPDYSAEWTPQQAARLTDVYGDVAARYQDYYRNGDPHFISLIDSKIAVILRGGYQPQERCSMGRGEMAFTPDGAIYPCERLVGDGEGKHCIGHIDNGVDATLMQCHSAEQPQIAVIAPAKPCDTCDLKSLCMNWCGCSNYFGSGYYDRASAFLCASERAAITVAAKTYQNLEADYGELFFDHATGSPLGNSLQTTA